MRKWKPVKRRCRNCGTLMVGFRDTKGKATAVCPRCGATAISWPLSRRCERCDTYAPPGTEIIDSDDEENFIRDNDVSGRG